MLSTFTPYFEKPFAASTGGEMHRTSVSASKVLWPDITRARLSWDCKKIGREGGNDTEEAAQRDVTKADDKRWWQPRCKVYCECLVWCLRQHPQNTHTLYKPSRKFRLKLHFSAACAYEHNQTQCRHHVRRPHVRSALAT